MPSYAATAHRPDPYLPLGAGDLREAALMFSCPVCGAAELKVKPYEQWPADNLDALTPPYEDVLGRPSYEVCSSCGYEFGNDDNPGTARPVSFAEYRAEWFAEGQPRFWG